MNESNREEQTDKGVGENHAQENDHEKTVSGMSAAQEEDHPRGEEDSSKASYEQIRETVTDLTDEDLEDKKLDPTYALSLFMDHQQRAFDVLKRMRDKSQQFSSSGDDSEFYRQFIQDAFRHHPSIDINDVSPFDRDGSHWRQAVEHNGDEIMAARPKIGSKGSKLSGESAVLRVRAAAELGTIVNVPLWHTGIWIKLKAPSEATLLELDRRIANEKITLARQTIGVSFTNTSVYFNGHLLDMIFNHVYDSTYPDLNPRSLKAIIDVNDIPQLVWGMACAIWPNGYRLVRPCVYDPTDCNHIDEAHVNVSKLSWVDNRALTTMQRNHMSERDRSTTDEQVKAYKNEHLQPRHRYIDVSGGMQVRIEVPTISEYETAGYRWIDSIVRATDEVFGRDLRGDERNQYIEQQTAMTNLRRYSHWISEIRFEDGDIINDRESIDESLDALTGMPKNRQKIIREVEKFIKDCVICAVGIPRYACPQCKREAPESDSPKNLPELIQLEINEIFFTLLYIRVMRTMQSD